MSFLVTVHGLVLTTRADGRDGSILASFLDYFCGTVTFFGLALEPPMLFCGCPGLSLSRVTSSANVAGIGLFLLFVRR